MKADSFHKLSIAAMGGNPEAQFELFKLYYDGDEDLDVPYDPETALKWLRKSFAQGYAPAIGEMGKIYIDGGIQDLHDPAKGVKLEIQAADKGYLASMVRAGNYLFMGKTQPADSPGQYVDIDVDRAIEYWGKAYEAGDLRAALALAKATIMGVGEDKDYEKVISYLERILREIDPDDENLTSTLAEAQFWIGYLHFYGLGVQRLNRAEAYRWFAKASEGCFLPAEDILDNDDDPREALLTWHIPYDYESWSKECIFEAYEEDVVKEEPAQKEPESLVSQLIRKAHAGDPKAWYDLGLCYEKGRGVFQSNYQAIQCYRRVMGTIPDAEARIIILEFEKRRIHESEEQAILNTISSLEHVARRGSKLAQDVIRSLRKLKKS